MAGAGGVVIVPGRTAARLRLPHDVWTWGLTFGAIGLLYAFAGFAELAVLSVLATIALFLAPLALLMRDPTRMAAQRWMAKPEPLEKTKQGQLRIDGEKLTLEVGEQRFENDRSALLEGFVEPLGPHIGALVLRFRKGDLWTLRGVPLATCEELLAELGVGPDKRVARMHLAAASSRSFAAETFGVFGPVFGTLTSAIGVAVVFAMATRQELAPALFFGLAAGGLATVLAALAIRRPPLVEVGREGLRVRGALRTQTISFGDVASVDGTTDGVALKLRDGRTRELVVTTRVGGDAMRTARAALETRIRGALAQYGLTHGAPLELLVRGEKPLEAWLSSLRELGTVGSSEGVGYRAASLDRETLVTAMEDPAVKPRLRVAAAVALMANPSEEVRLRIADASRATIDDTLREALEAAADDRAEEGLSLADRLSA